MHVNDPLDKEPSRCVLDLILNLLQILVINQIVFLLLNHRCEDVLCEFSNALGVSRVKLITQRHFLLYISLHLLHAVSALVMDLLWSLLHYLDNDGVV